MRYLMAVLLLLATPLHADVTDDVADATYQLQLQITEPGDQRTQVIKFCSASFFDQERDGYTYGTTAGHCLDVYQVQRDRVQERVWGADLRIVIQIDGRYREVEAVRHGMRGLQYYRDDPRNRDRPDPDSLEDWGVIKTKADVNTLAIGDPVTTGDSIHVSGYPLALGHVWSSGRATYPYDLPGTPYDGFVAADYTVGPGSSGSPVVNDDGEQVAILVAGIRGVNLSLSTPIHMAELRPGSEQSHYGGPKHGRGFALYDQFAVDLAIELDRIDTDVSRWLASGTDG